MNLVSHAGTGLSLTITLSLQSEVIQETCAQYVANILNNRVLPGLRPMLVLLKVDPLISMNKSKGGPLINEQRFNFVTKYNPLFPCLEPSYSCSFWVRNYIQNCITNLIHFPSLFTCSSRTWDKFILFAWGNSLHKEIEIGKPVDLQAAKSHQLQSQSPWPRVKNYGSCSQTTLCGGERSLL